MLLNSKIASKLEEIEKIDFVAGISSYNNSQTISHVISQANEGFEQYFSDKKCLIVVSDGNSTDGTREVASKIKLAENTERIVTIYKGISGKGSAIRTILAIATKLDAKGIALLDADLRSITPEWINNLLSPILDGFGFVTPYYSRYKYDGTITNNIAYPLTRSLYGKQVRQPIGGDFGVSGDLASVCLEKDVWETDVAKFGIDIFLTTTSICEGYKVCEANLGVKIHDVKDPGKHLAPMFRQVVGTLFNLMVEYEQFWKKISSSEPVPRFGPEISESPEAFQVDYENLIRQYQMGIKENQNYLSKMLPELTKQLISVSELDASDFRFPADIWIDSTFQLATAFKKQKTDRELILDILRPIWNGRTASFIIETLDLSNEEAEREIQKQAMTFEEKKPHLTKIY